jgi:adenylate cyclase
VEDRLQPTSPADGADGRDQADPRTPESSARPAAERLARLRAAAVNVDTRPGLVSFARRLRRRLPGDERFGDPLSTAGETPVQVIARGVSSLRTERDSMTQELGLAGLQVWQSLSEATGRGLGDRELAVLFTDLVGFSSWALEAGDAVAVELLREVGSAVEGAVLDHDGRIVKRLGDGVMAVFFSAQDAVDAALGAQGALAQVSVDGYRPRMRAGVHWGRPRKLGGDYLGVDVNIAARVTEMAKADQVVVSDPVLEHLELDGLKTSRPKRLRAEGAPRDLRCVTVERA